jgi:hypothetical protein
MAIPELQDFYLVGGTCLSLRYGHRKSIDLDLFSTRDFDIDSIVQVLEKNFSGFEYRNTGNTIGIFGFIDNVKVDFVKYHYFNVIDKPIIEQGIRMFSDRDIMAMKVFAILKRAEKKDFWDVAELMKHCSVKDFIASYDEKYPNHQILISIPQALIYFVDADESDDPVSLKGQTWESVKKEIQKKVAEYLKY